MKMRVLIAEDENKLADALVQILAKSKITADAAAMSLMKNFFILIQPFLLEPVFIRNVCGFSSIILLQSRQKSAGGLSPGKDF